MTYDGIIDKVSKLVKAGDVNGILDLITYKNRQTIDRHLTSESIKVKRYLAIQKQFKKLKGLTIDQLDDILGNGLTNEEIARELKKLK